MTFTTTQLVAAWKEGSRIPLPYFDGKAVELYFDDEADVLHFADAIRNLVSLTLSQCAADSRHLWAYFKDFTDDVGFEWVEAGMQELAAGSDDIWNFVTPKALLGIESWDVGNRNETRKFIVLEADCGWEAEHGLSLSWRDGATLVKVSAYDGHATNGHAYDDLSKDAFIYYSARNDMCTKP